MLTQTQVGEFRARGFLKGGAVLDSDRVEELRKDLDRVIREGNSASGKPVRICNLSGKDDTPVWQVVNIWMASDPFRDLISHRKIVDEIAQLLEAKQLRVWHDQIQFKPPNHGGVNHWHQDGPYWPILTPKNLVTAWTALDDVDESNGCMSMVPGSHLWGNHIRLLEGIEDFQQMPTNLAGHKVEVVRCPVRKGEVHYHHAMTWHGSHGNASNRPRRAIAIHYMAENVCYDAGGEHIMKRFVEVEDGAPLAGETFPLVWEAERVHA